MSKLDVTTPSATESQRPASYVQRAMWAIAQRHRGVPLNVMILPWRIRGSLNISAIEDALSSLIARHSALRTRLGLASGQLMQVIEVPARVLVAVSSVEGATSYDRLSAARSLLREEGTRSMDLALAPPLRIRLLRLEDTDHVLCLFVHHAICDGVSSQLIMSDLVQLYANRVREGTARVMGMKGPVTQYADFAKWQFDTYESGGFSRAIAYWRDELANPPPTLDLANGLSRKGNRDFHAESPIRREPAVVLESLKEFAQRHRVSLFSVLLSALAVLLHRRTGADELVIGVSTANRWSATDMQFVGCATNLLPARVRLQGLTHFDAVVAQAHATMKRLLVYGRVPLELILREMQGPVAIGGALPVWCQFREPAQAIALEPEGLIIEPMFIQRAAILCDLEVDVREADGGLESEFAHRAALFDPVTIKAMMDGFGLVLHKITTEGPLRISEL